MKKILIPLVLISGIALGQHPATGFLPDGWKQQPLTPLPKSFFPNSLRPFFFQDGANLADSTEDSLVPGPISDVRATYSHRTSRGTVFILSEDGMPCLVTRPSTVEPMPLARINNSQLADRMPNAFPKQPIVTIPKIK